MSARNALCLHDLYIHPSNLWKPKQNGASDWIRTMPHFFNSPVVSALFIHSSNLWKPKTNGASGWCRAERYLRADIKIAD